MRARLLIRLHYTPVFWGSKCAVAPLPQGTYDPTASGGVCHGQETAAIRQACGQGMIALLTDVILPALVFALMVIVGLELKRGDFATVARRPQSFLLGCLGQALVAPAAALLTITVLSPAPELALALALLSICPSGALSNLYTLIARGNVALSVCLTTASSALSILITPVLALALLAETFGIADALSVPPGMILVQLGLFVLIPVLLGMAIGHRFRAIVDSGRKVYMAAAMVLLATTLAIAVAESWPVLIDMFLRVGLLALALTVGALAIGRLVASLIHPADRSAWAIECAVRNIPVALLLANELGAGTIVVAFATGYFLVHAPLLVAFSFLVRPRLAEAAET